MTDFSVIWLKDALEAQQWREYALGIVTRIWRDPVAYGRHWVISN